MPAVANYSYPQAGSLAFTIGVRGKAFSPQVEHQTLQNLSFKLLKSSEHPCT